MIITEIICYEPLWYINVISNLQGNLVLKDTTLVVLHLVVDLQSHICNLLISYVFFCFLTVGCILSEVGERINESIKPQAYEKEE